MEQIRHIVTCDGNILEGESWHNGKGGISRHDCHVMILIDSHVDPRDKDKDLEKAGWVKDVVLDKNVNFCPVCKKIPKPKIEGVEGVWETLPDGTFEKIGKFVDMQLDHIFDYITIDLNLKSGDISPEDSADLTYARDRVMMVIESWIYDNMVAKERQINLE